MLEFEYKISEIIVNVGNSLELLSLIDLNKKNNSRVFQLSKDELITELIGKLVDLLEELKEKNKKLEDSFRFNEHLSRINNMSRMTSIKF